MKTPAQYLHQLSEFHLDDANTAESLETLHTQLREIETSLNRDLHALHSQFQGRVSSMHIPTPRKQRGKEKAEEEQRTLDVEKDRLSPYEDVKTRIEALLAQVDEKRSQLEKTG